MTISAHSSPWLAKRKFSHLRLFILLAIALHTWDLKSNNSILADHFQEDLNYCAKCFQPQQEMCKQFQNEIAYDNGLSIWQLLAVLPQRARKRFNQLLTLKSTQVKIIAKYLANAKEHLNWKPETEELRRTFMENERLNGMQFYPKPNVKDFLTSLHSYHQSLSEECLWLYMLVNAQPLIMPILYELEFPVAKTHATCGFTIYQEYAGLDLYHFKRRGSLINKFNIAHQILKAAVKFSHGFQNYRLYITDLTADNMVYDIHRNRLVFVDLDTLLVVDSNYAKYKSSIHKHEYIECSGCFAYAPEDISSYNISDINIYSACQFLREDLYKDDSQGFLYPLSETIGQNYPSFVEILNQCVDCPPRRCKNRFLVAQELSNLFELILKDWKD